ncbi:hypothetical protein QQS21_004100 [Conoideocrella luteorostrata]|uniref:Uncharacterized protein n=1 Tax=Conoideocrella luteorostrata TaxID=1105319 RepID=A0AAJ0CW88_9HYPO|nr:hypothetical protein QQS21_004100 [Conoideocrella luteorostrata]
MDRDAGKGQSGKNEQYGGMTAMPGSGAAETGAVDGKYKHNMEHQRLRRQQHEKRPCREQSRCQNQQLELRDSNFHSGGNVQAILPASNYARRDVVPRSLQSPIRTPVRAHVPQSVPITDSVLRDVVETTEQGLEERGNRYLGRQAHRSSPTRGSLMKTPQGDRRALIRGQGQYNRGSPAGNMVTTASMSPPGPAVSSLIAEATQQLQHSRGAAGPYGLRRPQWEAYDDQMSPPTSPGKKHSIQCTNRILQSDLQHESQARGPLGEWQQSLSVDRDTSMLDKFESEPQEDTSHHYNLGRRELPPLLSASYDTVENGYTRQHAPNYSRQATYPSHFERTNANEGKLPNAIVLDESIEPPSPRHSISPADSLQPKNSNKHAIPVSMTIAKLRRTDSIVSSYTAVSVASSASLQTDPFSLSDLLVESALPGEHVSRYRAIGNRNYFSVSENGPQRNMSTVQTYRLG